MYKDQPYNWQSQGGAPLSETAGDPNGSNGQAPSQAQQDAAGLTLNPPTSGQYQSLLSFGALAAPDAASTINLNTNQTFVDQAVNIRLPIGRSNNVVVMVMDHALVGAPFISREISFLFGSVIPVPDTDEYGVLLSTVNTNVTPNRFVQRPEDYWLAELPKELLSKPNPALTASAIVG